MTANGSNNKWIGKRTPRPDGEDKVTGRAAFGADFSLPGMLVGRSCAVRIRMPASNRSTSRRRRHCRASKPS